MLKGLKLNMNMLPVISESSDIVHWFLDID